MIRIGIVARGLPLRAGLRALLEDAANTRITAESPSLEAAESSVLDHVDVLLVDGNGITTRDLGANSRERLPAIVMLGGSRATHSVLLSRNRPVGLLGLEVSSEQVYAAIQAVASGLTVLEPGLAEASPRLGAEEDDAYLPDLTGREREVLQLVATGLPNKGIAARLAISEHTVKYHLASILTKLGAASRAEAVALAARRGLIAL